MGGNDGMVNSMRWTVYGGEHGMDRMAAPIYSACQMKVQAHEQN